MVNIDRRDRMLYPIIRNVNIAESYYLHHPLATLLNLDMNIKYPWVQVIAKMISYIRRNSLSNPARIIYPNLELNNVLGVIEPINFSQLGYLLQEQIRIS